MTNFELFSGGARRVALAVGTLAVVSLVAAACGGAGAKTSAGTGASATVTSTPVAAPANVSAKATDPTTPSGPPAAFRPAALGMIASVSGNVLEVQSPQSGQTTVNLSSKTIITATVSVGLSDVNSGTCISATGTKGSGGTVDATNVMIFTATKGTCVRGFGLVAVGWRGGRRFSPHYSGHVPAPDFGYWCAYLQATRQLRHRLGQGDLGCRFEIKVDAVNFSISSKTKKPTRTTSTKMVSVSKSTKYSKSEKVTAGSVKVGRLRSCDRLDEQYRRRLGHNPYRHSADFLGLLGIRRLRGWVRKGRWLPPAVQPDDRRSCTRPISGSAAS